MIFMLNDLFEMMITGLEGTGETEMPTGLPAFRLGAFTLQGDEPVKSMKQSEFADFTFIGFV